MPHQCTNCERRFPDGSKEMLSGCPDCGGNKFQFTPASDDSRTSTATTSGAPTTDSQPSASPASAEARSSAGSAAESSASGSSSRREWPETARRPAERDDVADRSASSGDSRADAQSSVGTDAMEDDFEWVTGDEDDAQATARSDVVSPDELPTRDEPSEAVADRSPRAGADAATSTPSDRTVPAGSGTGDPPREPPQDGRVVDDPDDTQPSIEDLREELNQQFESIKILNPGQYELNLMELYDREEHIVSLQEDGRYVINVPESWHDEGS